MTKTEYDQYQHTAEQFRIREEVVTFGSNGNSWFDPYACECCMRDSTQRSVHFECWGFDVSGNTSGLYIFCRECAHYFELGPVIGRPS